MTLAASPASDPRYAVTLGPATLEPTPKYAVSLGPATLEPVESKSSVPVLLMGVSLLAAVAVFSGTLRLGKRDRSLGVFRPPKESTLKKHEARRKEERASRYARNTIRLKELIIRDEKNDEKRAFWQELLDEHLARGSDLDGLSGLKRTQRTTGSKGYFVEWDADSNGYYVVNMKGRRFSSHYTAAEAEMDADARTRAEKDGVTRREARLKIRSER